MILATLLYGFTEILSYGGLYYLRTARNINYNPVDTVSNGHKDAISKLVNRKNRYIEVSPTLGWTLKKNGTSWLYQANSSGIRSDKEYEIKRSADILRISTFGDSFTHCDDVKNDETWQTIMETSDRKLEVINFGVPGFGLDQAYLRYLEDGRQYKSDIALIGFMTENIYRNVNTFRPFCFPATGLPIAKPRFSISGEKLALIPNPMQSLDDYKMFLHNPRKFLSRAGAEDYYYQKRYKSGLFDWSPTVRISSIFFNTIKPVKDDIVVDGFYSETSEAFRVTKAIFSSFYNAVKKDQAMPIIVIFPNRNDIDRYSRQKQKRYSPILSYFNSKGYAYIDLADTFQAAMAEHKIQDLCAGHYSPLANRLVAETLLRYKNENNLNRLAGRKYKGK